VLAALFLIVALATLAMPGSANFIGEFMILLGVFKTKVVFAVVAFLGVVGASYYALRVFVSSMHNRVNPRVTTSEIGFADVAALVPILLVILALAFYPQFVLHRTEHSVRSSLTGETIKPTRVAFK
jgi:NADH-quinone oxidoreductase subunit M